MFNHNVLNVLLRNFITDSMSHAYHTKTSRKGNRGEISREMIAGETCTCTYSHVPLHMQAFEKLMPYLDGFSHLFSCSGMLAANWDQRRNFSLLIIERRNANHERNIYEMPSICFDNLTGYGNYPSQSKAKGYSFGFSYLIMRVGLVAMWNISMMYLLWAKGHSWSLQLELISQLLL